MTSDPQRVASLPARATSILCVPTPQELERLRATIPEAADPGAWKAVEVLGFGPVAAAARGAVLGAEHPGADFVLAGIAGCYPGAECPIAVGEAAFFGSVCLDGVGAGEGPDLLVPSAMGFPQHQDPLGAVHETLPLSMPPPPFSSPSSGASKGQANGSRQLLTVCASAASRAMLAHRQARFPGAAAEDMEAFGLALAARILGRKLWVVRGVSNEAGDRDTSCWRIDDALLAAGQLLRALP